jgi:hypothetical protein
LDGDPANHAHLGARKQILFLFFFPRYPSLPMVQNSDTVLYGYCTVTLPRYIFFRIYNPPSVVQAQAGGSSFGRLCFLMHMHMHAHACGHVDTPLHPPSFTNHVGLDVETEKRSHRYHTVIHDQYTSCRTVPLPLDRWCWFSPKHCKRLRELIKLVRADE